MSFVFSPPSGFDPCGVAFGVLEGPCYSAPCRVYANGTRDHRIIWYRVPDDRPFYEELNTFTPRRDDQYDPSGHEYELARHSPNPRTYYSGRDIWYKPGLAVDGTVQDFLGLTDSSVYVGPGGYAVDPCDNPEHGWQGIELGSKNQNHATPEEKKHGIAFGSVNGPAFETHRPGLKLGTINHEPYTIAVSKQGLLLGMVLHDLLPVVEKKKHGLALGTVNIDLIFVEVLKAQGLELGTINHEPTPAIVHGKQGLQLGTVGHDLAAVELKRVQGIELGNVTHNLVFVEDGKHGLQLGNLTHDLSTIVVGKQGLQLGSINNEPAPSVTPGASCAAAGTIALNTDYTFTIPVSGNHWFMFPITGSIGSPTTYKVKITINSGQINSCQVSAGTTCGGASLIFTLTTTGCNSFTNFTNRNCYIWVSTDLSHSCNYTIRAGTGSCP